jgi:hypothetical protein
MTAPLRCTMIDIDHVGLPNEARTACTAPATLRRHVDRTGPVPCIEIDIVCETHWWTMYGCQYCGNDKGTWRGAFCQACIEKIEEHC